METIVIQMKKMLEESILTRKFNGNTYANGQKAKEALIRSQKLINLLHEWVKMELVRNGVDGRQIYPPLSSSKPELKIAGFLKQKDQDVCVRPKNIKNNPRVISWGPLANENITDALGEELSRNTLVVNIRSQLSSIAKNTDTLFERTFAESLNLHIMYPDMVIGEVYLIPVYEYDDIEMSNNKIAFKNRATNIEKYINFFSAISNRINSEDEHYKYEGCLLLIVDFSKEEPKIYLSTEDLKNDGLVRSTFSGDMAKLNHHNFAASILKKYGERFDIKNVM